VEDAHNHALSKKNVMISGGYSPFIGAGVGLDSWSFTVDLSEPDDKQQPVAGITVIELHEYIQQKLNTLQIDEMTISDELLVNGQDVIMLSHLMPEGTISRPVDWVHKSYVTSKIGSNDKRERHYRVVRIPMWDGQIFLSMYYRFLICNDNLVLRSKGFLATTFARQISAMPSEATQRELVNNMWRSVVIGIVSWIPALLHTVVYIGELVEELKREREWRREVEANRLYNYGWKSALREQCFIIL
jgi:hypothetical protein